MVKPFCSVILSTQEDGQVGRYYGFLLCLQEMPKKKQEMYRKLLADSEILIATSVRIGRQHNAVGQDFRGKDIHRELAG
ncbi:MAG: hypothetical protein H6Q92_1135 [Nitrospirae bacterium]|nr:hypothetical protein [Nitrospirota bacterium]